jgi:hypothetical protein
MGNGGITPHIPNFGARLKGDMNFTSWPLYAEGKFSDFHWIGS